MNKLLSHFDSLTEKISDIMRRHKIPGASVSLISEGKVHDKIHVKTGDGFAVFTNGETGGPILEYLDKHLFLLI